MTSWAWSIRALIRATRPKCRLTRRRTLKLPLSIRHRSQSGIREPAYAGRFRRYLSVGDHGIERGQGTFNAVAVPLADLQVYQNRIEKTDTVKAALDLNTAVGIKAAQINAELLRTNATQLYLQANAQNAVTSGQEAQAEFFAN